jgi:hypothetical protein
VGRAFVTMVSWVAGDPNLTLLYGADVAHPLAACILGLSYVFIFTLVLTTLLIGLMTTTLQKVGGLVSALIKGDSPHCQLPASSCCIASQGELPAPCSSAGCWCRPCPALIGVWCTAA